MRSITSPDRLYNLPCWLLAPSGTYWSWTEQVIYMYEKPGALSGFFHFGDKQTARCRSGSDELNW